MKNLTLSEYLSEYKKDPYIAKIAFEYFKNKIDNDQLNAIITPLTSDFPEQAPIFYINKDNIYIQGVKCTAGSKMMKDYIAPFSATITRRLKKHGCTPLGTTNLDEYAMGATGKTSYFGPAKSIFRNDKGEEMAVGGSGSGSATGLAANYGLFS